MSREGLETRACLTQAQPSSRPLYICHVRDSSVAGMAWRKTCYIQCLLDRQRVYRCMEAVCVWGWMEGCGTRQRKKKRIIGMPGSGQIGLICLPFPAQACPLSLSHCPPSPLPHQPTAPCHAVPLSVSSLFLPV